MSPEDNNRHAVADTAVQGYICGLGSMTPMSRIEYGWSRDVSGDDRRLQELLLQDLGERQDHT